MNSYDFLNLSPPEFEELSRDLLQIHLKLTFESFANGRDNGIDFRCSKTKDNKIIVQCKRYTDYNPLFSNLKKENSKLPTLKPASYILTTSVSLTPKQKDDIFNLFSPYILSTADIYGKDDLNNLIGIYSHIEKKHFKLWLSSTEILDKILHSSVYNQSEFEKEKIEQTVKLYVENESYYQSLSILKDNKFVVISGIPGIGKTTLARILAYNFLATGFDEFIFLSDSIKEGFELYKEGVKQIFLFDDFLGKNFLNNKLSNNEESRIFNFIEKVNTSADKLLILTTREYILAQARQTYEVFEDPKIEFAKCIIDLSIYTNIVRAKILYNHIFFTNISIDHIQNILEKQNYLKIIEHKNYNPRIIQVILKPEVWNSIDPKEFTTRIISFLDYPESVWKHVFENQISPLSQCLLSLLMSTGTPILYDDLKLVVQNFSKISSTKYGLKYSEMEFKKSIKELENTFIISNSDSNDQITIEYQNPSVQDFLVAYLRDSQDIIEDIIDSATFFNQLVRIFAPDDRYLINGKIVKRPNKIRLSTNLIKSFTKKLINDYEYLNSSILSSTSKNTVSGRWFKILYSEYKKLNDTTEEYFLDEHLEIKQFVIDKFTFLMNSTELKKPDFTYFLNLLERISNDIQLDKTLLISTFLSKVKDIEDIKDFLRFGDIYPEEFNEFVDDENTNFDNLYDLILEEVDGIDDDNLEYTLQDIKQVSSTLFIEFTDIVNSMENRIEKYKIEQEENQYDWYDDDYMNGVQNEAQNEVIQIKDMFESLIE